MRAWVIEESFGLENLHLRERALPEPGPGQVRVRTTAVSLNFRDLLMVRGHYNPRQPLPLIPCSDGVGVVDKVGPGVERVAVGDRVAGIFAQRWLHGSPTRENVKSTLGGPRDGTLAEYMLLEAEGVVAVPSHLSDVEAATLPCAAVTAWSSLVTEGGVTAGDRILILGTGGVSVFALQFAKMLGCETIVTSSSDEKLERAIDLGADHTINYRTHPEWWREVRRVTDDEGVDLVVEVGGTGTFDQSVRSVRVGGHVSMIGVLSGGEAPVNLTRVLMQNIRVQGVLVGHRASFEAMNRAIAHHELVPIVDRVFPFEAARDALESLSRGEHFGKIAISVG
jgi:NADPH:quinone reductase-like Zn-dependent oxidoreductase